jgi:hypothetical protein
MRGVQTYRFVVRGAPIDGLGDLVEQLTTSTDGDATTITCSIADQSHLCGVLDRIADIGLQLVAFERVGPASSATAGRADAP